MTCTVDMNFNHYGSTTNNKDCLSTSKMPDATKKVNAAFVLNNAIYSLEIHGACLQIKCNKTKQSYPHPLSTLNKFIILDDVIFTKCDNSQWMLDQDGQPLLEYSFFRSYFWSSWSPCYSLIIHYWIKLGNHCRKLETIQLKTSDYNVCREWSRRIDFQVKECIEKNGILRPKNLLIVVNPYAGNKVAKSVYEVSVSPLFEKAKIRTTVIFTEFSGHATEYLESADLSEYDGVVAIGGDGTFNEIVNGVLLNEQKRRGLSLDSEDADVAAQVTYSKPPFRLGLIPAGSGNALNYTTQGTNDVETATLHIICGESHPLDITSVYDKLGKLIKFTVLGTSYGFFSETIKISDNLRMLGRLRYKIIPYYLALANYRFYPGEVSYLSSSPEDPVDIASETSKCRYPCSTCLKPQDTSNMDEESSQVAVLKESVSNSSDETLVGNTQYQLGDELSNNDINDGVIDLAKCYEECEGDQPNKIIQTLISPSTNQSRKNHIWKVVHGPFIAASVLNTSCRYELCPTGFVPSAHLSDGTNDLVLVRKTTRKDFLIYSKAISEPGNHLNFPFVDVQRVKAMRFRIQPQKEHNAEKDRECRIKSDEQPTKHQVISEEADENSFLEPSCWTSDGELFDNLNITTWVHKGLISIFAKGLESD